MLKDSREILEQRVQIALVNLTTPCSHQAEEPFNSKNHQLSTNNLPIIFSRGTLHCKAQYSHKETLSSLSKNIQIF